jgi:SAM-dependent methyltransferase
MDVEHWNKTFPKYPKTIEDKGWVYGVWYCSTSFQKARLYGEYPSTFLKRALALFPNAKDILHCPSGTLLGPGTTVDICSDEVRKPQIIANANALPFPDNSFDLYLSDPPYSPEDSKKYGCAPYPMGGAMREARRVLRPNGWLGMLHKYYPSYHRKDWRLRGLICVVTGFGRMTRIFSVFQPIKTWLPPVWENAKH